MVAPINVPIYLSLMGTLVYDNDVNYFANRWDPPFHEQMAIIVNGAYYTPSSYSASTHTNPTYTRTLGTYNLVTSFVKTTKATRTPTATLTPTLTPTATITPSPTSTPSLTPTSTPVPVACGQQASYSVIDTYTYEANAIPLNELLLEDQILSDEDAVKRVIQAYFVLRYESEKNLIREDFSLVSTYEDPDAVEWLHRESSRQNILRYNAELFNTRYLDYKFTLDYIDLEINDTQATIRLQVISKTVS